MTWALHRKTSRGSSIPAGQQLHSQCQALRNFPFFSVLWWHTQTLSEAKPAAAQEQLAQPFPPRAPPEARHRRNPACMPRRPPRAAPTPSCTRRKGDPGTCSCIETSPPPAASCWKVRVSDANPVPRGRILQEQKLAAAAAFRCVQSTAKLWNIKCQQPSIAFFPPKTRSCSAHSVIQHLAREIYSLIITEMWLWKVKLLTLEISVLWWVLFGFFFFPFWLKLYYPIKTA